MPIHSSAHRRQHREPFPAPPSPTIYRNIAYTFVGLTVIIVVAALWFSSVHATVTIKATREPVTIEASVDVARSPGQGQLPGRVVEGVFEKIQEFSVTSSTGQAVNVRTNGKVRITNTTSKAQPLVKTTRLLTADNQLYRIDDSVNVPAKGTVDVSAHSDKTGAPINLDEGTDMTIPGLPDALQKSIYAETITTLLPPGSKNVKVLVQSDVDAAQQQLQASVLDQAKATLIAEVADTRFTESVYLLKVVEVKTNVKVGESADRYLMSLKLDVTGVFYPKTDMDSLVKQRVGERVPEGRDVVSYDASKTVFSVSRVDTKDETATVSLKTDVQTKLSDNSSSLPKDLILGLPIDDAEQKLSTVEGIESATITVRPSWVRRLPTLKDHITFKVE